MQAVPVGDEEKSDNIAYPLSDKFGSKFLSVACSIIVSTPVVVDCRFKYETARERTGQTP